MFVRQLETSSANQDHTEHVSRSILLMMFLIAINTTALGYKRKISRHYPYIGRLVQDATITTLLGVFAGVLLSVTGQSATLTTIGEGYQTLFMIVLLPPIIFESTINMHKETFFKNIGSILMFAIFGTLIAIIITAIGLYGFATFWSAEKFTWIECLAFGSLISATDPVSVLAIFKEMNADKTLWSLIFGESILNDAISIVSYNTVVKVATETTGSLHPVIRFAIIFFGSLGIGIAIGVVCAYILKKYFGTEAGSPDSTSAQFGTETTFMIIAPWVSYLIGEGFGLSGIVTIVFCGIAINKYALCNMSTHSRRITQHLYAILSSTFENLAFMFIGLGFFSFTHEWGTLGFSFFILSILIITFARFSQIYFISFILNLFRHNQKISRNFQAVMAHSGFRGAMAFALATNAAKVFASDKTGPAMLTLTIVYASFTTFFIGSVLVPLFEYYDVKEKPNGGNDPDSPVNRGSSRYLWNRFKVGFGILDDMLIELLVRDPKENARIQLEGHGDDISSPSKTTRASLMSSAQVFESEMTSPTKSSRSAYLSSSQVFESEMTSVEKKDTMGEIKVIH